MLEEKGSLTACCHQVKRLISKRDNRLKENKEKADLGQKKKAASANNELVREMYVSTRPTLQATMLILFALQTTSAELHVLPTQHCPCASLPGFSRYQLLISFSGGEAVSVSVDVLRSLCLTKYSELLETMMTCLYAKCNAIITDCVMAELEKLGPKYRIALRIARDERLTRLKCDHKGTYADDCIVDRIQKHRIYIVATNDKDLKRRIRKVGVPLD